MINYIYWANWYVIASRIICAPVIFIKDKVDRMKSPEKTANTYLIISGELFVLCHQKMQSCAKENVE
ncbi:hypothetical protein D1970_21400 [Mesobacillus zeae]|uniref:Uncharacterized protein n=1 Tax=Mesobacillus zeae TaxID=1917180 RepID=A0A398AV59_9BACI|nr:hypothetical protein D1970_21400 [Mesobacillus zeae]